VETAAQWLAAIVAAVALVVAVQTSRRQRLLEANSYLVLGLTLHRLEDRTHVIASTSLENRSPEVKLLDTVFLLVSPSGDEPVDAFNTILQEKGHEPVRAMSDFGAATRGLDPECHAGDRHYVRLDYYTRENSEVADEVLTYEAVLDVTELQPGVAYSVRLFLYGPDRLHRVVQRALVG
jgi:hypothetical protein